MKPVFIAVDEQDRAYYYPNSEKPITLRGVVSINVSKSGTHRLNLSDGTKVIMAPGWQMLAFNAKDWTF